MKFAAFGRTRWLYDAIVRAVAAGHEVVLIGTCAAEPEYTVTERDFERLAADMRCRFFNDARINDERYIGIVRDCAPEVAISVNWLTMIGREMIGEFPRGIINAHAGDLPRYRGNACPNWAILNGESEVVVSLHEMVPELDAGPVLLRRAYPLRNDTYIGDVYRFLDREIPAMFVAALEGLSAGTLVAQAQPADPALSLRCYPRLPRDGEIDWTCGAEKIVRLVRASAEPFAGAYTYLNGHRVTIWRARCEPPPGPYCGIPGQVARIDRERGEVAVIAGHDFVILEEVEDGSGRRGPAAAIIASTRARLGLDLGSELSRIRAELNDLRESLQEKLR